MFLLLSFQVTAQYEFTRFDLSTTGNSSPNSFYEWNGKMYFSANDGINGVELWVSDGTASGTFMIKDIYAGNGGSYPSKFKSLNNKLIFNAGHPVYGIELWVTDGTASGTQMLKDVSLESLNSIVYGEMIELNNKLYFGMYTDSYGQELWSTDGTTAGTTLIKDIFTGTESGFYSYEMKEYNGKLYFLGIDNLTVGEELWVSDGTTNGTYMLKEIQPGPIGSNCNHFEIWNNELYFIASSLDYTKEIWRTDGTELGTTLFIASEQSIEGFYTIENYIYFDHFAATSGLEVWRSTINPADKELFADLNPGLSSSNPIVLGHLGNDLYISAIDNEYFGSELYSVNMLSLVSFKLTDIQTFDQPSFITNFIIYNNTVFFRGSHFLNFMDQEKQLYRSDDTQIGTYSIAPVIAPISSPLNNTNEIFLFDDALFFSAHYDINGEQLWRLDDLSLSIFEESTDETSSLIYPNPTTGATFIQSSYSILSCEVYNLEGREISCGLSEFGSATYRLNSEDLHSGIYFVHILTEKGLEIHRLNKQD